MALEGRDLLTLADLTPEEVRLVIERAKIQKRMWVQSANRPRPLADRAVAIIMLKPSLRTRVSFEIAVRQLGGTPIVLGADTVFSRDESVRDTVKTLERYCECIIMRTFKQAHIEQVAEYASVPVVNALTDDYHPCQVLADLLTIEEHYDRLESLDMAYVGDGNNMANTLLIGCALAGMHMSMACPPGHEPLQAAVDAAKGIARETGSELAIGNEPRKSVTGADVVVTDTWVSMGQEEERAEKVAAFAGYTVDPALMSMAKPEAIFMHCLPAHRGEEVTDEVIDGPQSVVFTEAENRMRAQKALLSMLLERV